MILSEVESLGLQPHHLHQQKDTGGAGALSGVPRHVARTLRIPHCMETCEN